MTKFCVSLTTIPSRLKKINKTLESLKNQTLRADKIFINIPIYYKRFPNTKVSNNFISKIKEKNIEVIRCEDFGPATKLMGSLNKVKKYKCVIILDDDHIYNKNILKILISNFKKNQNCYSFFSNKIFNIDIAQGADSFLINTKFLNGIKNFYRIFVEKNKNLFLDDDFWISLFLQKIKKKKIINLIEVFKKKTNKKIVYQKHIEIDELSKTVHKKRIIITRRRIQKYEYIKFLFKNFFIKYS